VAAPTIRLLFSILVSQYWLKGTAMQIQFDHIGGRKRPVWHIGEEEFVDDTRTRDANPALLFASWMSCHHHAAALSGRPHRHIGAVVETAHHLTFRALLKLVGGQMQTCRNARVIEHTVFFATGHKREASQIGEHRPGAILPIKSQKRAVL
jgi:hypothetical protein